MHLGMKTEPINLNLLVSILMLFVLVFFSVFLIQKGRKKYSSRMLFIYFLGQIIVIGGNVIDNTANLGNRSYLIVHPVIYTWAASFYLYIASLLNPSFRLSVRHSIHLVPAVIVLVYLIITYYSKDYATRMDLINKDGYAYKVYALFQTIFNAQIIGYNISALVKFRTYVNDCKEEYSVLDGPSNFWLKLSIFGFFTACMIVQASIYFRAHLIWPAINWYLISNITFLLFFILLFYVAILNPAVIVNASAGEKYRKSSVMASEARKLADLLDTYMEKKQPYRKSSISLKDLATETGIQERHLSQVINEIKKQNFFDYVNSFRVRATMELLSDPDQKQRKMLDILFDCGFNSKTTFNAAFKKYTGLTPSEYRKNQI
jgi:AraC-like DNA-binding protein